MAQMNQVSSWWGRHSLALDRTDFWQIGPLKLWLNASSTKLATSWANGDDFLDGHVRNVPGAQQQLEHGIVAPDKVETVISAYSQSQRNDVVFAPMLPDRPVVLRIADPIRILPGEEVTLYMVVPLFIRLELSNSAKLIYEIPTYRLSDTWFGPLSTLGGLCYASASPAYLDLREVPLRAHCAITAITIKNSGLDALKLDRLNIPFPRLSLFYSQRSGFWTDRMTLERNADNEMANVKLDRQPPAEASPTQFVTGPRHAAAENSPVIRAFSAIFKDRI